MAEEPKKISFGFSKISKKPAVIAPKKVEKEIQFIDCLEGNSIKLVSGEEQSKEALVIPLKNGNILRDNMIEVLKSRKEAKSVKESITKEDVTSENGILKEEVENKPLTLDELAAKEILEDLQKTSEQEEIKVERQIPATNTSSLGEKESTLEDYENIPVGEYGLAMLRGMGWVPDKGVGKNGQVVQPVNPVLRPKGMGLGADKVLPTAVTIVKGEELVMKKSASLKILSGPYKDLYGKIEGFDELPGRIMVRLALQNSVISISENLVQLVTSKEYSANSKILNLKDYNKYHEEKEAVSKSGKIKFNEDQQLIKESTNAKKEPLKRHDDLSKHSIKEKPVSRSPSNSARRRYESQLRQNTADIEYKPEKEYMKKKRRDTSSESESYHEKEKKKATKKSDPKYQKLEKDIKRNMTTSRSSSEERYQSRKSKKDRDRSPSSDSEYETKNKKSHKKDRRRNYSSSSEYERERKKGRGKTNKTIRDKSVSTDSEEEKRLKKKKSHRRKDESEISDSDSSSEYKRSKQKKKKNHSRHRSRSTSPSRKKKKKKHHRSKP